MEFFKKYRDKTVKLRYSKNWLLRIYYWINKAGYLIIGSITDGGYRRQFLTKLLYKKHFHQTSYFTEPNRYPDLFQICKAYLKDIPEPKILSFGCSTGEEVFSLCEYVPKATIVGTDISLWCLNECRKKKHDKNKIFIHSLSRKFERMNNFDAIFCLAVFQHPENRHDETIQYSSKYSFDQFEKELTLLDKKLKTGGVIFIDQCDFDFLETKIAENYCPLRMVNNKILRERPLFNRSNRKISDTSNIYRVFVKSKY